MDTLIYFFGRVFITFVQRLSLPRVARLGRALGSLAFRLDARHRRVVLDDEVFRPGKNGGGNRRDRARKFPAHRRKLFVRHQDVGHDGGRAPAARGICRP
jgi:hypothetical protein